MIADRDTNQVFVSEWLPKVHPAFFSRFSELLKNVHINMALLSNTADIWCRDYMPIQLAEEDFLQYRYYPDYLTKKESDKQYITDTKSVCNALKLPNIQATDLIIDGGNVVKAHDCIIMTEKVFHENAQYPQAEVLNELEHLFHCELIMLPWDKYEKYGHADGIVKPIDESHLLMTNYADYDQELAEEFERRLGTRFRIEKLHYHVQRADKRNWAYINFLQVGNNIVLPAINTEEDEQVMEQIKTYYPSCNIYQLDSEEIIKQGGALNCITWNIKK